MAYRILSFDGGGLRGVIPTIFLQRLISEFQLSDLVTKADLLAGTSTGGLIALCLASEKGLDIIRDLYISKGPMIFKDSVWDNIHDLGNLRGAQFDVANLENVLKDLFGDLKLSGLTKKVMIPTFDLKDASGTMPTWKPKIFHNFSGEGNDGERLARKVGAYSAAAPTYFQSVDGYIDGGVFANNPSMCALAQTHDRRYFPDPPALENIRVFSLGTGISLQYINGDYLDWGELQWVKPLVNLMLDGVNDIASYQCRQLLGDACYLRLQPVFPEDMKIDMASVKQIPWMVEYATQVDLSSTAKWLKENW
jgi:uncharacterized protein